jgi:hypothetical protein
LELGLGRVSARVLLRVFWRDVRAVIQHASEEERESNCTYAERVSCNQKLTFTYPFSAPNRRDNWLPDCPHLFSITTTIQRSAYTHLHLRQPYAGPRFSRTRFPQTYPRERLGWFECEFLGFDHCADCRSWSREWVLSRSSEQGEGLLSIPIFPQPYFLPVSKLRVPDFQPDPRFSQSSLDVGTGKVGESGPTVETEGQGRVEGDGRGLRTRSRGCRRKWHARGQ